MNTDDGRLFGAFGAIIDGQWKVSVPTGNYVILSDDFRARGREERLGHR